MGSNWRSARFKDLIEEGSLLIGDGYRAKLEELGGDGMIFLRAGHVSDKTISFEGVERFKRELTASLANKTSCPSDTVITTKGNSTGRTSFVTDDMPVFVYSPHLSFWRSLRPSAVWPGFLRYWSQSVEFAAQLDGMSESTDMAPYLSLRDQRFLRITLPSLYEQKAIARVLGVLDDKIELNRRMNRTLEDLARALFKSWFVDFDPVVAKAAGKNPVGMSAQTAALFLDRFQDSALGPIPKGWNIGRIRDLCVPQYGYTTSAKSDGVGPKLLRVTDMNKEPWIEWNEVPICTVDERQHAKYRLRFGDVLVSRMADPGKAAIVEEDVDAIFASYLIRLNRPVESDAYFLFYTLRSDNYLAYAEGATSGTVQANMNAQVITAAEVVIPPVPVRQRFSDAVSPLRQKLVGNLQQNRSLAALRDALLPQLMSGEFRVRDAEWIAEGVK